MITKKYKHLKKAVNDTLFVLLCEGIFEDAGTWQATDQFKDMRMKVLRNYHMSIEKVDWEGDLAVLTGCDKDWCNEHFGERIGGIPTNPGKAYKNWPYHKDLDNSEFKNQKFSHTYQERIWPKGNQGIRYPYGDLYDVVRQLKNNDLTRQAYLPIWFPEDTWASNNGERVPCTLGYYYYITNRELHCNYVIRSCDAFRHFRNDVYLTLMLQKYIAELVEVKPGKLNISIYHLHLFENDMYNFRNKEFKIRNV